MRTWSNYNQEHRYVLSCEVKHRVEQAATLGTLDKARAALVASPCAWPVAAMKAISASRTTCCIGPATSPLRPYGPLRRLGVLQGWGPIAPMAAPRYPIDLGAPSARWIRGGWGAVPFGTFSRPSRLR
jgi:hypothetical protein